MHSYQTRYVRYPAYTVSELQRDLKGILSSRSSAWTVITNEDGSPFALLTSAERGSDSFYSLLDHASLSGRDVPPEVGHKSHFTREAAYWDTRKVIEVLRQTRSVVLIDEEDIALIYYPLANTLYRLATGYDI